MKTNKWPRYWPLYKKLRRTIRRELEACGIAVTEHTVDDYLRVHFRRIALDLKHMFRADLEEKEKRFRDQLSRNFARSPQAPSSSNQVGA
jgi:hypothetical protein